MPIPLAAAGIMAGGSLLGGLGGKEAAKPRDVKSWIDPPSQLGGWGRLQQGMDWMDQAYNPSNWYRPGANNPMMQPVFQHIMGRSGMDPAMFSDMKFRYQAPQMDPRIMELLQNPAIMEILTRLAGGASPFGGSPTRVNRQPSGE